MRRIFGLVLAMTIAFALVGPVAGAVNRAKVRRPGPTRVLLLGDSITAQYGPRAAQLIGSSYEVDVSGTGGSGLLDRDSCNGFRERALETTYDPDIVIVEYTGNYNSVSATPVTPCDDPVTYGSNQFFARWKQSAKLLERIVRSHGARVIWMQVPMVASLQSVAIAQLNSIYRLVSKDDTVDAWTAFGGPTFTPSLHDGPTHLSPSGIELMAQLVAAKVRS